MVFKVVNDFLILIWELQCFFKPAALLVLVDLLDLLDLNLSSSLLFVLIMFFVQCDPGWPFCKHMKHWIFFQYFLSYVGSCLLLSPPLWANVVHSDVVYWLKLYLVYFSSIMRVTCMFLVYRSSHVVKLFGKYTLNLLCWFPLFWGKMYERYLSSVSVLTSNFFIWPKVIILFKCFLGCVLHYNTVLSCFTNIIYNINLSIIFIIIFFICKVVLMEYIQCTLLIVHCCISILVFGLSQYPPPINFSRFSGYYDSLVVSQYGSCFILSRRNCMHWPLIIDNACPRCLSISAIFSPYVRHLLSCSTLASTSKTMVSMWWILYWASVILLLRISK